MPERENYWVFSAEQAAGVLGIKREAVLDLVARRRAKGQPVSWARDEPTNPTSVVLVLADFVREQARARQGIVESEVPFLVPLSPLPHVPGVGEIAPQGRTEAVEVDRRLEELTRLVESSRSEALEERMARLEAVAKSERERADREAERAQRAESETQRWKNAHRALAES